MKKLFLVAFLVFLTGCSSDKNGKITADIQKHYNNVQNIALSGEIYTNLDNKMQKFGVDFTYTSDGYDEIEINYPEEISGIKAKIYKNDTLELVFDDLELETLTMENMGISPVDMISFAIDDIKNRVPEAISISDVYKLSFENEKIYKDIYLNAENYDIMKIEIYIDGNMSVYGNF